MKKSINRELFLVFAVSISEIPREDMKMKKYFAIMLAFVMIFACVGCGSSKYTAPIQIKLLGDEATVTVVDDFDSARLLEILNKGKWENGLCDCANQFYLTVSDHKIGYSTSCKTFNNTKNGKSLVLDDATAEEVKEILYSMPFNFDGEETSEFVHDSGSGVPSMLEGEVLSISNGSITVKNEQYDGLGVVVSTSFVEGYGYKSDVDKIKVGDFVHVLYDGKVAESYPPQILTVYSINIIELPIID